MDVNGVIERNIDATIAVKIEPDSCEFEGILKSENVDHFASSGVDNFCLGNYQNKNRQEIAAGIDDILQSDKSVNENGDVVDRLKKDVCVLQLSRVKAGEFNCPKCGKIIRRRDITDSCTNQNASVFSTSEFCSCSVSRSRSAKQHAHNDKGYTHKAKDYTRNDKSCTHNAKDHTHNAKGYTRNAKDYPRNVKGYTRNAKTYTGINNLLPKKTYNCLTCGLTFPTKHKISIHMYHHTQGFYLCSRCSITFPCNESLQYHINNRDCESSTTELGQQASKPPNPPQENNTYEKIITKQKGKMTVEEIKEYLKLVSPSGPFRCPVCQQTLSRKKKLKNHMHGSHNEVCYKCDVCPQTFARKVYVAAHMKRQHPGSLSSKHLNKSEANSKAPSSQPLTLTGEHKKFKKVIIKEKGGMSFIEIEDYLSNVCDSGPFKCCVCLITLKSRMKLAYHMHASHSDLFYKCNVCSQVFSQPAYVADHVKRCHFDATDRKKRREKNVHDDLKKKSVKTFECPECGKVMTTKSNFDKHKNLHLGLSFSCSLCPKTFANKYYLKDHMNRCHRTGVAVRRKGKLVCTFCKAKFSKLKQLECHTDETHEGVRLFACNLCSFAAVEMFELRKHLNIEHPLRGDISPYRCFHCKTCVFPTVAELDAHITEAHPTEVKMDTQTNALYECSQCGEFYNAHKLKDHFMRTHIDKALRCGQCNKVFSTSAEIRRHMTQCQGHVQQWICDECGKTFTEQRALNQHKQNHREITYSCDDCGEGCKSIHEIRRHVLVHLRIKILYKCDQCDKSFRRKESRRQHRYTVHNKLKFSCELCDKSYTRKLTLANHILQVHGPGRPRRECSLCPFTCIQLWSLKQHLARQHPGCLMDLTPRSSEGVTSFERFVNKV